MHELWKEADIMMYVLVCEKILPLCNPSESDSQRQVNVLASLYNKKPNLGERLEDHLFSVNVACRVYEFH